MKQHPDILDRFLGAAIAQRVTAYNAEVSGSGAVAQSGGVAAGAGGVAVAGNVCNSVIVTGENLRDKELAYLDSLLSRYQYWLDHYTPLAGIAEVRAAVQDGPRLDLPMPFIPAGFEKLVEHGYGERSEVRRVLVDDLRTAVAEHRRILLLGDPGSGKTTTLWRLAYDYANAAQKDGRAPLPVLVSLGSYTDDSPFEAYLARSLGPLAAYLDIYRASGRLILLLDGLNEMPQADYVARVGHIRDALAPFPDERVVVTCRALDYVVKLEGLQKVEVLPLDPGRIRTFLHNYLGQAAGEWLFWAVAGKEVRDLWEIWRGADGTWDAFWSAEEMPSNVYRKTTSAQDRLWRSLRQELPPLLSLSGNPYMLLMTAQVYAGGGGELPANRARLFAAFVDALLDREKARSKGQWIDEERQQEGLAALAYAIQEEGGRGTTVARPWAAECLRRAVPTCDVDRLLYLATSATLLDADDTTVRFHHQLLQEYFAARGLGSRVTAGEPVAHYWPADRWWEPAGWEETFVLLAGMQADASELVGRLAHDNPALAARCLLESGSPVNPSVRASFVESLIGRLSGRDQPAARVAAGDVLSRLGDPRRGVGLRPDGLPDIAWCDVPAGPFLMGSADADGYALDSEKPQHKVKLPAFRIARYPVTHAQYAAFVRDGGYTERWRGCWTDEGWRWKEDREGPPTFGGAFGLPNHPVMAVTWYEAMAFGGWLTTRLRQTSEIGPREWVVLPAEAQWEKAARGTDGRVYPWGEVADPNRANYGDTGIGATSAVGCFPGGASPYGCEDMSGNVWEWCHSVYEPYPYRPDDGREDLNAEAARVLRGGSFYVSGDLMRCAYRYRGVPDNWGWRLGFRVVVSPGFFSGL